jgi:hypothetical protein
MSLLNPENWPNVLEDYGPGGISADIGAKSKFLFIKH